MLTPKSSVILTVALQFQFISTEATNGVYENVFNECIARNIEGNCGSERIEQVLG